MSELYYMVKSKKPSNVNWGCGVILHNPVTNEVLVGYRTDTKDYATPGGKVETGESPLNAVVRETYEECGLLLNDVRFIGVTNHKGPQNRSWTSYVFYSNKFEGELKDQPEEIGQWAWYPFDTALQFGLFEPTKDSLIMAVTLGIINWGQPEHFDANNLDFNGDTTVFTNDTPVFSGSELPLVTSLYAHGRFNNPCAYSYQDYRLDWL